MTRSPAAKNRRWSRYHAASGRRVACDTCKALHPPPECPPDAVSVTLPLVLPPWLHERVKEAVPWGERSPWVVRLIRKELGV